MATSRSKEAIFSIVEDGTLELEVEADCKPDYRRNPFNNSLVVTADMLIVIDGEKLQLHRRHDGKLLAASDKLESYPSGMCLINNKEVAVILKNSVIEIMTFESTHCIERVKRFHVTAGFYACHSVAKVKSMDKLVVSGWKMDHMMLYWCVVNLTDGRVDSTQKVCEWGTLSHLAVKNNTVYISCHSLKPSDTGVYSYNIPNPKRRNFLYRHSDLNSPSGLCVDTRDYIYVCNYKSNSIHQLTARGELVTIHKLSSSPCEIFYEEQDVVLYIIHSYLSNTITRYRLEYPHQQGVPVEILNMDKRSIQLFEEALQDGKETVYHIRVMVVGHLGVGKTTLIKHLLGEEVNISERHSTEGIDVYINCCDASLSTLEWTRQKKISGQDDRLDRFVRVQNEQQSSKGKIADNDQVVILPQGETTDSNASVTDEDQVMPTHQEEITDISASVTYEEKVIITQEEITDSSTSVTDKEQVIVPPQGVRALKSHEGDHAVFEDKDTELLYHHSPRQDHALNLLAASQLEELPSAIIHSEANTIPMLKLLQENSDKLKQDTNAKAKLTIWDFSGRYAFYTTHQIFLTQRAIYLMVSDVSQEITALVPDDCYFDSKGIKRSTVRELTDVWLNSIHSCASSPKASTPPVILVGTHVDKLLQKQSSAKLVNLERQSTQPSTSTHAASAMEVEPMTSTFWGSQQESFEPPRKQPRLEVKTVASMTGVYDIPSEDQLKKQRNSRLTSGRKQKIVQRDLSVCPLTEKPVGEIIVGADAEKVSHDEICKRYFREIRSYLKDKPTRFHLVDEDFAIDNTIVDKRLEDLKRKIVEVASQQPYWGEEIPARWILLEQELMTQKAYGVKVISHKEVENLNKKGTVRIEKDEELDLFLRYLHETGRIIYFSIEVLRDIIVLDPLWLIDALKSLISAQPTLQESTAENGSQSTSPLDHTITQRWSDFKEKGILRLEIIDAVWTQEKHPELHTHRDHILQIMEQLNIIAKPRSFSEIGEKVENYFLAPCMIQQDSPKEVISTRRDPRMVSTPIMQCVFRGKFLPSPIFHRLLAACVSYWPVAKKQETAEHLIFCGCCVFDIDLFHRFTLYFKNHVISARITRMVIDEVKIPDPKLCSRVRRFITQNLSKITSYLGQNLQYDLHVKCPPFQMWNADEGPDLDAPVTPEHMNYARLCVALVTVCGNALRDILLNQVPAPHTTIYQALLANKANLTTRRREKPGQWQNALLNHDQIQLVFKENQGQRTGTVDQFDLSLLYTLIRNVSTVTAPLTGWGNYPHDQPRDTSLGASVERIRSYRNHISGHSPDGKLSRQDLEDYWNKFKAVLHDIEAATGRQLYIPELEKQKRQVISIHEAKITKHEQQNKEDCLWQQQKMEWKKSSGSEKGEEEETQDLQGEEEFLEAIKSNVNKVEDMISKQMIPKLSTMMVAIKRDGYSIGVKKILFEMSELLKREISEADSVWCGYRPVDPHLPVFVVTLKTDKCIMKKEKISEPFFDYEIITRYKYVPNDEERSIIKQYGSKSVRSEDVANVNNCIAKHTKRLMREHSNLSIIRSCNLKAYGYMRRDMKVKIDTCIVLCVPVKGIIPVGENQFPKDIDGIVTDVREGEFVLFGGHGHNAMEYHPKLRIGCVISNDSQCGSLGGFIDLPDEKVGCLTAAHVVLPERLIEQYIKMGDEEKRKFNDHLAEEKIQMYQPQPESYDKKPFGNVQTIALEWGDKNNPSVDAALIHITDDRRKPEMGSFPDHEFRGFGLTNEDPLLYSSGEIQDEMENLHSSREIQDEMEGHWEGYLVIKFGCTTGLTFGKLKCTESSVRPVSVYGNYCFPEMFKQLEVSRTEDDFADHGDSGALVFICVDNNIRNLRAVGMVIGENSTRSTCLITPIKAVFEKLGLVNKRFKVFPTRQLPPLIERIATTVDTMEQNINSLSEKIETIETKISGVDAIHAKINSLEAKLTQGISNTDNKLNERFNNITDLLNQIINRP